MATCVFSKLICLNTFQQINLTPELLNRIELAYSVGLEYFDYETKIELRDMVVGIIQGNWKGVRISKTKLIFVKLEILTPIKCRIHIKENATTQDL